MRVIQGWPGRRVRGRVATLGVFDGVHRGHARILRTVRRWADRLGLTATVITFDDHPHGTLLPDLRPPRLAPPEQCQRIMKQLNMDEVLVIPFTKRLARVSAGDFLKNTLLGKLRIRHLVVGPDFVFGRRGRGTLSWLLQQKAKFRFSLSVVPPLLEMREVISSTGLRAFVAEGRMERVRKWLGRPYALHGVVVRGDGRGRDLGFPTANLKTGHEVIPGPGIYLVRARWGRQRRKRRALCYIGRRPTFYARGMETIEVFIPGWRGSLYGKRMEIEFWTRLRGDRKFANSAGLQAQMRRDWRRARAVRFSRGV